MASSLSIIINIILLVSYFSGMIMWTCVHASSRDTLKPGDTLNASSSLLSASGTFNLSFFKPNDGSGTSYLAVMHNEFEPNQAWIGNRETPISDPPSAVLTLDSNNTLKIMHRGGHPIIICSAPSTSVVVATILDSGNLVLAEVNSTDGSQKRIWWQSFDYPGNTFLPDMKLGVNHSNGYVWSLTSWITDTNASRGLYTLDWDPKARQLELRRLGVLYWTSGIFTESKRRFKFILPDESKVRYDFSIVSNEHEDSISYTNADVQLTQYPEWVLSELGRLYDYDGDNIDLARADYCDGYSTRGGCQLRVRADDCMAKIKSADDAFEFKTGYFKPINSSNTSSRCPYWLNLASDKSYSTNADCNATCWQNCDCLGFDIPFLVNQTTSAPGCRFWSVDCEFIDDFAGGSSNGTPSYVGTGLGLISAAKSSSGKNTAHKWIWIASAIVTALVLVLGIVCYLHRRRSLAISAGEHRRKIQNELLAFMKSKRPTGNVDGLQDDGQVGHDLSVFSYASVLAATCNFSEENKLGEGGFGPVYKGILVTGQEIAVKRLSNCSSQGVLEFKNELILIYELQHTNLVQLFGFCIHGEERMLIYEYLPNKSLDNFLFGTDSTRGTLIDWNKRFCIIEGIAQGLLYLHKYSRMRVIHRDLKASNILLDGNMNPKISDFGMARIFTDNERQANTNRIVGTYGYMSPEYAMEGIFSVKSDVYSFGVLMLEIISGRKNSSFYNDDCALNIVGYAWKLWKDGEGLGLMDPALGDTTCVDADQLLRCIHVALLCVEESATDRPTMFDAISMLTNESLSLPMPAKPAFCSRQKVVKSGVSEEGREILSSNDAFSYASFGAR